MDTELLNVTPRLPVRWPFRILAAIVVLAVAAATVGTLAGTLALGRSHDAPSFKWQFLAGLPGMAWLARLAWYAAIRGKSPASPCWPFASYRVFFIYVIIWAIALYA